MKEPSEDDRNEARDLARVLIRSICKDCKGITNLHISMNWYADIGPHPERNIKLKYSEIHLGAIHHY